MAAFLVLGTLSANAWVSEGFEGGEGVLGGPLPPSEAVQGGEEPTVYGVSSPIPGSSLGSLGNFGNAIEKEGVLASQGGVLVGSAAQSGVIPYIIQKGDTLSDIAAKFGISTQTILGANPGLQAGVLKVGESISILPVSGVLYQAREGETLESIAAAFSLSVSQLREFNRSLNPADFGPGTTIIIPGARPTGSSRNKWSDLPSLPGYFSLPTRGFNWGYLHNSNAVDIANTCGIEVAAAAEGLVVPDGDLGDGSSGWNSGYGKFVLLEHPNGTKTRYAHLESVAVDLGDYLNQGEKLGAMGNTGNVHGPTGCHLHFEVYGAQNPFAK